MGKLPILNITVLFVNFSNPITYPEYNNELNTVPTVDWASELYVILRKLVPIAVFLFIVYKYWALFVVVITHDPTVCPAGKALYAKDVNDEEHDVHCPGSFLTEHVVQVEWQNEVLIQLFPAYVKPVGQVLTH